MQALTALVRPYRHVLIVGCSLLVVGTALYARLVLARLAEHPGHADEAFHYTVAENLADGRGFVIDYIWHYLAPPAGITHPSNDYWLPLASVAMSLSLAVFGKSVFIALLPGIAAGLALALLVYRWSRPGSRSVLAALGSAGLVLFEPNLFAASLVTATVVYFALLASSSLLCMARGQTDPRFFLLAAVLAALSHLTRHDGFLLLLSLGIAIWLGPGNRAAKLGWGLSSALVYVLTLSPWLALNYRSLGSPFPPGALRILLVSEYEDRYAYAREVSLRTYLEAGLSSIVWAKADAAGWNLKTLWQLGGLVWIAAAVGIIGCLVSPDRRPEWRRHLPALVFLGALFVFHTLMPFSFALVNSAVAILPFLVVVATEAIWRHARWAPVSLLILLLLGGHYYSQALRYARTAISLNNDVGRQLAPLQRLLANDAGRPPGEEVVIMTRIPWEVHLATRYRAVQVPNDDLPTILEVARRYRANYLLLPAKRKALAGLYEGTVTDERFQLIASIPYSDLYLGPYDHLKLFRIAWPRGPDREGRTPRPGTRPGGEQRRADEATPVGEVAGEYF